MATDKVFFPKAPHSYLLIQGICLASLAVTHVALATVSIIINKINIHLRRSALPVILKIIAFASLVVLPVNTVYFESMQPLLWTGACVSASMLAVVGVHLLRVLFYRKEYAFACTFCPSFGGYIT